MEGSAYRREKGDRFAENLEGVEGVRGLREGAKSALITHTHFLQHWLPLPASRKGCDSMHLLILDGKDGDVHCGQ